MTEQLPKGYSPRLYNQDLGPLPQKWTCTTFLPSG
jgi:NCS1 family nucleobase:cation symporter-1